MDTVENEDLKLMQSHPRFYLANYFSDLKREVDLVYAFKSDEKDKYMEIINKIELAEQECYQVKPLIEPDKYKIEKKLFKNQSFIFMKDYGLKRKTFLLIINDEYLTKTSFRNYKSGDFNRESLIAYFLDKNLKEKENSILTLNVFSLDIDILNQTSIDMKKSYSFEQKITQIDQKAFDGLISLTDLNFSGNQIKILDPTIFNGLFNLKNINFNNNLIEKIDSSIFNGLTCLKTIKFGGNLIKELHESTFNGLNCLNETNFERNRIQKIHSKAFNDLINLSSIKFNNNLIKELDYDIFKGLTNLKSIDFSFNQLKELYFFLFTGLSNLQSIHFNNNQITQLHPNIFAGLKNLKHIYFNGNQLQYV